MLLKELIAFSITAEGQVNFVALQMLCSIFALKMGILDENIDKYFCGMGILSESGESAAARLMGGADEEPAAEAPAETAAEANAEAPSEAAAETAAETAPETAADETAEATAEASPEAISPDATAETPAEAATDATAADDAEANEPDQQQPEMTAEQTSETFLSEGESEISDMTMEMEMGSEEEMISSEIAQKRKHTKKHKTTTPSTPTSAVQAIDSDEISEVSSFDANFLNEAANIEDQLALIHKTIKDQAPDTNVADLILYARRIPQHNAKLHRIKTAKTFEVILMALRDLSKYLLDQSRDVGLKQEAKQLARLYKTVREVAHINLVQLTDDLQQLRQDHVVLEEEMRVSSGSMPIDDELSHTYTPSLNSDQEAQLTLEGLRDELKRLCNKLNDVQNELTEKTLIRDRENIELILEKVDRFERYYRGEEHLQDIHTKRINELHRKIEKSNKRIEYVEQIKATYFDIEDAIKSKAEIRHLRNKVSRDELFRIQKMFEEQVHEMHELVKLNETNVMTFVENLQKTVSDNLPEKWVEPLRKEFMDVLNKMRDNLLDLLLPKNECKTLLGTDSRLANLKCLGCGTKCNMVGDKHDIMPIHKNAHKGPIKSPLITFEVSTLRKGDKMGYAPSYQIVNLKKLPMEMDKIVQKCALKKPSPEVEAATRLLHSVGADSEQQQQQELRTSLKKSGETKTSIPKHVTVLSRTASVVDARKSLVLHGTKTKLK